MSVQPLEFIYLTYPEKETPILNIRREGTEELQCYAPTRGQLLKLNFQTAQALWLGGKP